MPISRAKKKKLSDIGIYLTSSHNACICICLTGCLYEVSKRRQQKNGEQKHRHKTGFVSAGGKCNGIYISPFNNVHYIFMFMAEPARRAHTSHMSGTQIRKMKKLPHICTCMSCLKRTIKMLECIRPPINKKKKKPIADTVNEVYSAVDAG